MTDTTSQEGVRNELLARFPALTQLSGQELAGLIATASLRKAPAGSVLFEPGRPCAGFPLVLEGSVRVSKTSPGGREIVLYRVEPGEGCILSGSCLIGHQDYAARGVAESDVTLLNLPPDRFGELIVQCEPFRRFVFDLFGARLAEVMEVVDEVAFRKLDTRLARLLIQRGPLLHATHQQLADELGSSRVFISRLLGNFEERGWLRLERERISVLDVKALADFARQP